MHRFVAITRLEPPLASPYAVHPCRKRQGLRQGELTAYTKAEPRPLPRLNQRKRIPIWREVWVLKRLEVAKLPERVIIAVAITEERIPHTARTVEERHVFREPPVIAVERAALKFVERGTVQLVLLVVQHAQERAVAIKPAVIAKVKGPVKILERGWPRVAERSTGRKISCLELSGEPPGEMAELRLGGQGCHRDHESDADRIAHPHCAAFCLSSGRMRMLRK